MMRLRKFVYPVLAGVLLATVALIGKGGADVRVNVGIFAPPPPYVVQAPPTVYVIPGTYVYYVPDLPVQILFHHGHWYRPFEGRWYRSRSYNGPWVYVAPPHVPHAIAQLPPHYHTIPPGHQKIPYGQLKKNWSKWEKEKHWHKEKGWREARHEAPVVDDRNGKGKGQNVKGQGRGHN